MKKYLNINSHVAFTLSLRLWNIIAGAVLILGIPRWFNSVEQGYYFTFISLVGLQVFFELGLNFVVMQIASHEMAFLTYLDRQGFQGEGRRIERLASLVRILMKWYKYIALFFVIVVGISGYIFLEMRGSPDVIGWEVAWCLLVFFSAINLYLSPFLAIFEGVGMVGRVARLRLIYSVIGYLSLWVCLELDFGLYAVPLVAFANSVATSLWIKINGNAISHLKTINVGFENILSWRNDIFPFQWKIALSWVSGYFIFQLLTPVIFAFQGAKEAGRIGLTMAVYSSILSLSMSWINSNAPVFSGFIARHERNQLNNLFKRLFKISFFFNFLSASIFVLVFLLFKICAFEFSERLSELNVLICFFIVCIINHIIFSVATYMRAHKEEPMVTQSVVCGVLTLLAVYFGAQVSVMAAAFGYLSVSLFVALPWSLVLFKRFYI